MAGHVAFYRSLVRLYPKGFRHDYADDLIQNFADLIAHHGPSRTWRRTAVDLAVTVPRYRLETVMNPRHTNTTLYIATAIAAIAAVVSITTDLFPGGFVLLAGAAVLTVVSASKLARSTRPVDTQRRRHLLVASAVLAATCVISTTAFWIELADDANWHGGKLVVYNAVFFITAIGALVCLVLGLRTRRTPTNGTRIAGAL
jgi:hypothetical protein